MKKIYSKNVDSQYGVDKDVIYEVYVHCIKINKHSVYYSDS